MKEGLDEGKTILTLTLASLDSGLGEMVQDDFDALGGIPGKNGLVLTAGQPVGKGLSKQAAEDLGLEEGTAVGSGVIDASVIFVHSSFYHHSFMVWKLCRMMLGSEMLSRAMD